MEDDTNYDSLASTYWSNCSLRIGKPWSGLSPVCATLLLLSITTIAQAQDRAVSAAVMAPVALVAEAHAAGIISGTVVESATQSPVFGALVGVGVAGAHTTTDANGRFIVGDLPGEMIAIQVRALGYRPVTDTVRVGERDIRIRLTQVALALDAIVVTGTAGATQVRSVGNAVTRTSLADLQQAAPMVTVQERLAARVPGLMIMPVQGSVGSGAIIRIRGVTSLFLSNDPLVYVDGVRVDNNPRGGPVTRGGQTVSRLGDVDPEEIETVEVIKGPAAGTLYGTEASRGVIQILTRRGVPGPTRFGITVRQGANWFPNPAGRLNQVFARNASTGQIDSVNLYQRDIETGRPPIFNTGRPRAVAMNLSGGTATVRFHVAGDYDRDEGVVSYDWRNRVSGRANMSVLPSDRLDIETSVAIVRNDIRLGQPNSPGDIGWDPMTQLQWGTPRTLNTPLRGFLRTTPEAISAIVVGSKTDRVMASVQIRHRPWNWFSERLTVGTDVGLETSSTFYPSDPALPFGGLSEGDKLVDGRRVALSSFDYVGTGSFSLSTDLKSTTSAGTQYYTKRIESNEQYGHGFPAGVTVVSGAAVTSSKEDAIDNKGGGVFAQQQIGWKNRRFLTGAVRVDDNSAFGANFNFVMYPNVSASWVLNEERFWHVGVINGLKLRAAWGLAGRQPDAYTADRTYLPVSGPGGTPTFTTQNVGNPDLKPERGQELEVGFDAGLWRDRASATFTYYRQIIKDAIAPKSLAPSTGFAGVQLVNLARVQNAGFEASLDARLLDARAIAWDLGVSFSTNHNRIASMGGLEPTSLLSVFGGNLLNGQWHVQGYPVGAYFLPLVVSASIDASGNAVNIMCASGPEPGAPPASCDNTAAQRVYAGQPTPSWMGSVRSGVTLFRNLKLRGLVDFKSGNVLYSGTTATAHCTQGNTRAINQRTDPILLAYCALNVLGFDGALQRAGLVRGGFVKLREVSLAYTLPVAWAARIGASSATFTVAGRNLAILWQAQTDAFGVKILDPETRNASDLGASERNLMPGFAQAMVALRVTF